MGAKFAKSQFKKKRSAFIKRTDPENGGGRLRGALADRHQSKASNDHGLYFKGGTTSGRRSASPAAKCASGNTTVK